VYTKIVTLAVVILLLAPTMSLSADRTCGPATQVKIMTPFQAGRLAPGLTASSRGNGKCFAASAASAGRPDAWRCSIENAIHDPCFQNVMGDPNLLACPESPWSTNVVLVTLTSPLPTEHSSREWKKDTLPWALELTNGERCSLFTGATAPIAGMRINYGCPGGFIVVGDIDRSESAWRVFFQGEKSFNLEQVEVAVAWY